MNSRTGATIGLSRSQSLTETFSTVWWESTAQGDDTTSTTWKICFFQGKDDKQTTKRWRRGDKGRLESTNTGRSYQTSVCIGQVCVSVFKCMCVQVCVLLSVNIQTSVHWWAPATAQPRGASHTQTLVPVRHGFSSLTQIPSPTITHTDSFL